MELTEKEFWIVLHGMLFGAVFLLAFAGSFSALRSLTPESAAQPTIQGRIKRLLIGMWVTAAMTWGAAITGTYMVYPWYRESGAASPRTLLLGNPATAEWQTFGMQWKEHVAWFAPILATAAAFLVTVYGPRLAEKDQIRRAALALLTIAFAAAAVAGILGAFLNKLAPIF